MEYKLNIVCLHIEDNIIHFVCVGKTYGLLQHLCVADNFKALSSYSVHHSNPCQVFLLDAVSPNCCQVFSLDTCTLFIKATQKHPAIC